jgi:hypothetical protein
MSTPRDAAIARVRDATRDWRERLHKEGYEEEDIAERAVAALYPQIFDPKQFLGIPEGSIVAEYWLGAMRPPYTWEGGKLHRRGNDVGTTPAELLRGPGEVYVLWMP